MNLRWTVEFAAAIAWQGTSGLQRRPDEAADHLWRARETARQLISQWQIRLQTPDDPEPASDSPSADGRGHRPSGDLLAEIFVTAMPVRLWAAVLCAGDRESGKSVAATLSRSLAQQHSHLLSLALQVVATPGAIDDELFFPLNRLRRQTERWTDLLIGRYAVAHDLDDLAFDPDQARDFGQRQFDQSRRDPQRNVPEMVRAGLRLAFGSSCRFHLPSTGLLASMAHLMLSAWDDEAFAAGQPLRQFRRLRSLSAAALLNTVTTAYPARIATRIAKSPSLQQSATAPPLRVFPPPPTGLQISSIRPEAGLRSKQQRRATGIPASPGFRLNPPQ